MTRLQWTQSTVFSLTVSRPHRLGGTKPCALNCKRTKSESCGMSSFSNDSWAFVFLQTIDAEGEQWPRERIKTKTASILYMHVCSSRHTHAHAHVKERQRFASSFDKWLKTEFNQLRQKLKMSREVDRHSGGDGGWREDRREGVRDPGLSL